MDRTRLETEFRKNKELKKKAEQYAIEAKQTAQRLSAENFKLKEGDCLWCTSIYSTRVSGGGAWEDLPTAKIPLPLPRKLKHEWCHNKI